MLKFTKENTSGFKMSEEEKEEALSSRLEMMEEQALNYFSGYLGNVMRRFHGKKECETCDKHFCKITSETGVVEHQELFTFLKRYDDDTSTLFSPSDDFAGYVRKCCLMLDYCFKKCLTSPNVLQSLKNNLLQIPSPDFCSKVIKEKVSGHIAKTLFLYHLKKINDNLQERGKGSKSSQRKLKILTHQ